MIIPLDARSTCHTELSTSCLSAETQMRPTVGTLSMRTYWSCFAWWQFHPEAKSCNCEGILKACRVAGCATTSQARMAAPGRASAGAGPGGTSRAAILAAIRCACCPARARC